MRKSRRKSRRKSKRKLKIGGGYEEDLKHAFYLSNLEVNNASNKQKSNNEGNISKFLCTNYGVNLFLIENSGNGNCQFISILQALHPEISAEEEYDQIASLREICAKEIYNNYISEETLRATFEYEIRPHYPDIFKSFATFKKDFSSFVKESRYWGDNLTLTLLSKYLGVNFFIRHNNRNKCCFQTRLLYDENNSQIQKPIILLDLISEIHYRLIAVQYNEEEYSMISPKDTEIYNLIMRMVC